jgi:hypothetical protein
MLYQMGNDLGSLLEDMGGAYDIPPEEIERLACTRLSPTRLVPVADFERALRIERGEEEPDWEDVADWQCYRSEAYREALGDSIGATVVVPVGAMSDEALIERMQAIHSRARPSSPEDASS